MHILFHIAIGKRVSDCSCCSSLLPHNPRQF